MLQKTYYFSFAIIFLIICFRICGLAGTRPFYYHWLLKIKSIKKTPIMSKKLTISHFLLLNKYSRVEEITKNNLNQLLTIITNYIIIIDHIVTDHLISF